MMQPNMPSGPSFSPSSASEATDGPLREHVPRHQIVRTRRQPAGAAARCQVPAERIGVVVLTNAARHALRDGCRWRSSIACWTPVRGMIALRGARAQGAGGRGGRRSAGSPTARGDAPRASLASYAASTSTRGTHPRVAHEGGRLALTLPRLQDAVDHWHYEVFRAPTTTNLEQMRVQFRRPRMALCRRGRARGAERPADAFCPPAAARDARARVPRAVRGLLRSGGIDWDVVLREGRRPPVRVLGPAARPRSRARDALPGEGLSPGSPSSS